MTARAFAIAAMLAAAVSPGGSSAQAGPANSNLRSVAAISPGDAWAVGSRTDTELRPLIEHWNGKSWRSVKIANPPGGGGILTGVAATSARDVWAVGISVAGQNSSALIEHWNGRSWRIVPSPAPFCDPGNVLSSVSAISATNAWAVGTDTNCFAGVSVSMIVHWNGRKWKRVASPDPGQFSGTQLTDVTALSASNIWAVGNYSNGTATQNLIVHWNGRKWKKVPSPDPLGPSKQTFLTGVAGVAANDVWAVGTALRPFPDYGLTVILHWNGHAWKRVPSPQPGMRDELGDVSVLSAHAVWAAGEYQDSFTGKEKILIMRWNGRHWTIVPSRTPSTATQGIGLSGIAAISGGNAWAVGGYASGQVGFPLIEHWNGIRWRRQQ